MSRPSFVPILLRSGSRWNKHGLVNIYARALRYFRPFFWPTLGGILLTFVSIAANLLKPWPFKYIVDGVLDTTKGTSAAREFVHQWFGDGNPSGAVLGLSLVMVAISLLAGLVNMASNYLFIQVGLRSLLQLRTDLYAALPSITGKFELEYEGELRGAEQIARDLIRSAVGSVFAGMFDGVDTRKITTLLRKKGAQRSVISTVDLDRDSLVQKALDSPPMAGSAPR